MTKIFAVHVLEFGTFDLRKWASKPEGEQDEFWKAYEQFLRFQEKDASLNNGQGIVFIIDFDGFGLKNHASANGELAFQTISSLIQR